MNYYRMCSDCGTALDPGERCDCRETNEMVVPALGFQRGSREEAKKKPPWCANTKTARWNGI